MEKGEAGEKAVVAGGLGPVGETLAGSDVHLVSEHHALGVAGGAGGVDEHGDVVGGDCWEGLDGGGVFEGVGEVGPAGVGRCLTGAAD